MKCIILAGGFGTRLRPLTNTLPKPMVPVANTPMIERIVDLLKAHKITNLTSLLYFQPESIVDHLGDGARFGVDIKYISPNSDLGTAGSVGNAMRRERGGTTLVISGDVLTDIDLTEAVEFHKKKRSLATIVLTRVDDPLSFGIVITDKAGRIVRFLEKPGWGEVFSDTINTGIYILERKVLDFIPEDVDFDFSKDLFPLLLEKKKPLYGYIADGYWKDVGSLQEYRQANMDILHEKVAVSLEGTKVEDKKVWMGEGVKIDFTSELEGSVVVGNNSVIEAGAKVINSVLGSNVVISEGAVVRDSVVWDGVRVGRGASLQENVVGKGTFVEEGAHLGEGAVVSDNCRIGRNSSVKANVKVWPHKEVDDEATLATSLIWGQRWARKLFTTYGVTGLANIELTPEFAAKVGAAYGASLPKGSSVSTSRDSHKTSRMINRAVMTGILSTGINVHDYGVTPIPVVRYLARFGSEICGIHSRRSPFDPGLLDMKFFDSSGLDLHPSQEKAIEKLFFGEDFARAPMEETGEMVFPIHGIDTYINGFFSTIDVESIKEAGFKIVLDYSYGSSSRIFPTILGRMNCDSIALNANLDASRTTKTAAEFENSLEQLSSIVRTLKADIGFLLDAGGEKLFIVDDTGDILDGNTALNLITLLAVKTNKDKSRKKELAIPVTASRAVEQMAARYGFKVRRTKASPRGIMEAAAGDDVMFVGEGTGGFIFPEFQPVFDGMFAVVKTLEMLAAEGKRTHKLLREIPPSIMVKERVSCSWENKGMIMRRLAEGARGKKTTLIDGIKINYGDDWIIAYPSQTHSYFHIQAEAGTAEKAKELCALYSEKIRKWQGEKVAS